MLSDDQDEYIKGKQYGQERFRFVQVGHDAVVWEGPSCSHFILRTADGWHCDCSYGRLSHLPCCHVRALESLLSNGELLLESATEGGLELLEWIPVVWDCEPVESCWISGADRRRY